MLFAEHDVLDRPAAAVAAGFAAIESWWPPDALVDEWAGRVLDAGVAVSCLNAWGGDLAAGERGFLNDGARRREAVAAVERALAVARRVGARRLNVLVGRELPSSARADQIEVVVELLRELAATASELGVTIVIEPINELDVPGYLVPTPAAAASLLERVGAPNVRILYDAYHVARSGLDPVAELAGVGDLVGHVQFADCPGRGAPGTGRIDLEAFVGALDALGYDGEIGLEFDPAGPTAAALAFLHDVPAAAPFPASARALGDPAGDGSGALAQPGWPQ